MSNAATFRSRCHVHVSIVNFSPEATCLYLKPWSNPISRCQLVPIGMSVGSAATPTKPRSHQGHVCVLSSQVNHLSNVPATGLKLTDQDRVGDTLSEGLNPSGGTQRCTRNPTAKSSAFSKRAYLKQVQESCKLAAPFRLLRMK